MKAKPKPPGPASELRRRAEVRLRDKPATVKSDAPQASTLRLLQELQIHQIELEMQNEELKHAKAEVEAGLEQYTDLYDFAPVGYFTLTAAGSIRLANLTGASLVGIERSRLVGRSSQLLVAAPQRPDFQAFLQQVFADQTKRSGDFELATEAKPSRTVHLEAQRLPSGLECRVMMVDITERKQAETMLRRNEELFSALIEQAPLGVLVMDSSFCLQQVNPVARLDFSSVHLPIGRHFFEIMQTFWSKPVADQIEVSFRHTLETGESCHVPEFAERRRDIGTKEVYDWQVQRVTLPTGAHRIVCFFNNITKRKHAEETQRRLEVMTASNAKLKKEIIHRQTVEAALTKSEQRALKLLQQSRELQKKVRNVSHQILQAQENLRKQISHELHDKISQLLLGISMHLGIFTKAASTNPQNIQRSITPLRRMVEQSVRVVHQFSAELRPLMLDELGLIPTLRTFIDDFPKRKGRTLHFTAHDGVEALDNDKRTMLYRVAQEALINVAKHAKASVVNVVLANAKEGVSLEITDNGKAFDVSRIGSAKWANHLGLAGMRERVEMVGGVFTVTSTPGTGTTIKAVVPLGKRRRGQ